MEYRSYRGITLLAHATKVAETIFTNRIRQQITIYDMQFWLYKRQGNH